MNQIIEDDDEEVHYSESQLSELLYGTTNPFPIIWERMAREKADEFWSDKCWTEPLDDLVVQPVKKVDSEFYGMMGSPKNHMPKRKEKR